LQNKLSLYLVIGFIFLGALIIGALQFGVYQFGEATPLQSLWKVITADPHLSPSEKYVIWDVRLARIVMAVLVGSLLAVAGTCMQGMFKNPLATPDLIGINAGATFMAAITIVLGSKLTPFLPDYLQYSLLSVATFLGALFTTFTVYRISTSNGKTNVVVMLLSGVAISALGFALTGFLIYISKEEQLRSLTFWNLGNLGGATWMKNAILLVTLLFAYSLLIHRGKALNAMMLGEKDAEHLGIPVEKIKKQIVVGVALMIGVCVAFSGTIGFVGLIVPYILRLVFKSNYHLILPLSAVLGSVLLLIADTISRTIVAPSEIPIGILTGLMGAPVFIAILIKYKNTL
jgi:iron complex transport system permease protein